MKRLSLYPLLLLLLALGACSDDSAPQDAALPADAGDARAMDMPSQDAPVGDLDTTCPASAPAAGRACLAPGLRCGYGDHPSCGAILECLDGSWIVAFTLDCAGVADTCPSEEATGFCPDVPGKLCRYDGILCTCQSACSGQRPPPGEEYHWSCALPMTKACPATPPAEDASCDKEGLFCSYGSCDITNATCTDGKWELVTIGPPP